MLYSNKYNKKCELYKRFGNDELNNLDFSEKAKEDMYLYESRGIGKLKIGLFSKHINGFFYGKRMLDITVAMWLQDPYLFIGELYNEYPHKWLDSIFHLKPKQHEQFVGFEGNKK